MKKAFLVLAVVMLFCGSLFSYDFNTEVTLLKQNNPDAKIISKLGQNTPALITSLSERVTSGSIQDAASNFIAKYSHLFSINNEIGFVFDKVINGKDEKTVRFNYIYKGYPVYPAGIAITLDNNVVRKASFFRLSLENVDVRAAFNREDAYYLVTNKYASFNNLVGARYNPNSVREIVFLMGKRAFFAYEVKVASFASMTSVTYYIDAKSGKLLFKKNNVFTLNKANVYNPNPGVDGTNPTVEVDIENLDPTVTDKTLTGTLIRSTNCYGLGEQKEFPMPQYQTTMRFSICNISPKAKSDENGDFYFTPDDPTKCFNPEDSQACFESVMEDDFAEVMMYYHANKMYTYFKEKGFEKINTNSGLPSLMTVVNFKIPNFYELRSNCVEDPNNPGWNICTTDKFMPFDNAAFIPYDGSFDDFGIHDDAIVFGQGEKVDFSYDAEVTYHEFTHAMIGSTSNLAYAYFDQYGMYIDPGAMNEGLADYFSSTVSGDPKLGEYVSNATEDHGALRDLSIDVRCPDNLWGESHNDGLLLSNALWKVRMEFVSQFGSEKLFDQKVYDTVVALSQIATFGDFTKALVSALKNDSNIGEAFATKAEDIFKQNNILDCERLVSLENGKYILLVEGLDIVGLSPYAPGYLQFYYDMPENTSKFMLDMDIYSNSVYGGSDAEIRILMKKDNPVEFDINSQGDITSNADFEVKTKDNSHFEVAAPEIEGGHRYYIAFVNYGGAQGILQMITPSVETQTPQPDAGVEDTSNNDTSNTDVGVVEDTGNGNDIAVQPDATEDVVVQSDVIQSDVSTKDASVSQDIIVIDGSPREEGNDESGCSCSLIE